MKQVQTYIFSAFLVVVFFLMVSWIRNYQTISSGKTYEEIRIGEQVWMAQNLSVVTFRNGDTIPQAKTKAEWRRAYAKKQAAWCYYNNDSVNGKGYGMLYNWSAVIDKRGLAPAGWHIPSGKEWHILYDFTGGNTGNVGRKLKSTTGWNNDGNGDNTFGFNAFPAGVRTYDMINRNNGFRWRSSLTIWWSTNKPENRADIECFVIRDADHAVFEWHEPWDGYSVRCVKD